MVLRTSLTQPEAQRRSRGSAARECRSHSESRLAEGTGGMMSESLEGASAGMCRVGQKGKDPKSPQDRDTAETFRNALVPNRISLCSQHTCQHCYQSGSRSARACTDGPCGDKDEGKPRPRAH